MTKKKKIIISLVKERGRIKRILKVKCTHLQYVASRSPKINPRYQGVSKEELIEHSLASLPEGLPLHVPARVDLQLHCLSSLRNVRLPLDPLQ